MKFTFTRTLLAALCASAPLLAACDPATNPGFTFPTADGGALGGDGGASVAPDGGPVTADGGPVTAYQDCPAPGDGGVAASNLVSMNLQTGQIQKKVDLSCFAENTGYPRPASLASTQGKVYVALQDFDRFFTNFKNGKVVVIDPVTDRVLRKIELANKTNISDLRVGPTGLLYVVAQGTLGLDFPGFFADPGLSGGIDIIDPVTDTIVASIDDDLFGGNVTKLEVVSTTRAYAIIAKWDTTVIPKENKYLIKRFDPSAGTVEAAPVYAATGAFVSGMVYDAATGFLYVAEGDYVDPRVVAIRESTGVLDASRTTPLTLTPQSMDLYLHAGERKLVVAEPDFSGGVGAVQVIDVTRTPPLVAVTAPEPVSSDPVVRVQSIPGTLPNVPTAFVINRFGADNIQWLDPTAGFATRRIGGVPAQWSTGNGSNPQDALPVSPTKLYVTLQQ